MASRTGRQIGLSGGGIGDELRAESVDETEGRMQAAVVRYKCEQCVLQLCRVSGVAVLVVEESSQGTWRPTVMMCVRKILFASALLCDCVVAQAGRGDRSADADDVVVGNRKDAEVAIEEVAWESKPHASPCASLCGPATPAEDLDPMLLPMSLCATALDLSSIVVCNHVIYAFPFR
jgi:hypothetical protein